MRLLIPLYRLGLTLAFTGLLLAGCATQTGKVSRFPPEPPPRSGPTGAPSDVGRVLPPETERPGPSPAAPEPADPATPSEAVVIPTPSAPNVPRSAEAISGQAVASLVRQARSQRDAGQPQQAQALLERAVRIEPRNYFVWSAMAQAYLDQKNYDQAESVARKSNSLARGNVYVQLENWRTIRAARAARGDSSGAAQAAERVEAIQQVIGGS